LKRGKRIIPKRSHKVIRKCTEEFNRKREKEGVTHKKNKEYQDITREGIRVGNRKLESRYIILKE